MFVAKLTGGLSYLWASEGGSVSLDSGEDVAFASNGDVYVTGSYSNTVSFGSLQSSSLGGQDAFLVKFDGANAVGVDPTHPPSAAMLGRAMPNPFGAATIIPYGVSVRTSVSIIIYDVAGRRVRTLVDAVVAPASGYYVTWDGRTDAGTFAPSGVYMYRMTTPMNVATQKMVLLR